jgi:hypothetical protein
VNDGRPNGELLLSTGTLQDGNMSDCLYFPASLIAADRCGVAGAAGGSSCNGWPSLKHHRDVLGSCSSGACDASSEA